MKKSIWFINDYAGSRYHGMEFRTSAYLYIYILDKKTKSLGTQMMAFKLFSKERVSSMVTNLGQWRIHFIVNIIDIFKRFYEGIKW